MVIHRDAYGHYFIGTKRVTLDKLRSLIKAKRKFKVKTRGANKDITALAVAHALAYQPKIKKRGLLSQVGNVKRVFA